MITCMLPGCGNRVRNRDCKYCSRQCSQEAVRIKRGVCQSPDCQKPLGPDQKFFCSRACSNRAARNTSPHSEDVRQMVFKLWLDRPDMSAAEIGRQAGGLTKNTIIGMIRRAGLPHRKSPIGDADPQTIADRIERSRAALAARMAEQQQVRAMTDMQIQRLRQRPRPVAESKPPQPQALVVFSVFKTCQWVTREGSAVRPWEFCKVGTKPGSPYCFEHHQICYTKKGGFGYENPEKAVAAVGAAA